MDDVAEIRRMIRFIVESLGHRVLEAGDGIAGLKLLTTERPDLVILDVNMPGPSGLDVCRTIRASGEHDGMAIMILTAGAQISQADALASGASTLMTKPFSPAALVSAVSAFKPR